MICMNIKAAIPFSLDVNNDIEQLHLSHNIAQYIYHQRYELISLLAVSSSSILQIIVRFGLRWSVFTLAITIYSCNPPYGNMCSGKYLLTSTNLNCRSHLLPIFISTHKSGTWSRLHSLLSTRSTAALGIGSAGRG